MKEITLVATVPELKIRLFGEIDVRNRDRFLREVTAFYTASPANILLDCTDVTFIDSRGIGALVSVLNQISANGHTLTLCSLNANIKRTLIHCNLADRFIFTD